MESILIRVPTSITPTSEYIFNPTRKLLGIVRESMESGAQKELALRLWDTARSGTPFLLAKNVIKRCWDATRRGPPGGDDEET